MTTTIFPQTAFDNPALGPLGSGGGLAGVIQKYGKPPTIQLIVKPLQGASTVISNALNVDGIPITKFLNYKFSSSVIVPVDTFNFSWASPDAPPVSESIKEGDIVVLTANDIPICTGVIDQIEIETDGESGEKVTITGRDLMAQLEDQDAVSLSSQIIYAERVSLLAGVQQIIKNTRINSVELKGQTPGGTYLLASEPGESKLAVLQRFLEPLNCIAWMAPNGSLNVGKPDMAQSPTGSLFISKANRQSNCLSMRVVKSSTQIPNIVVPMWTGQEQTVSQIAPEQALINKSFGPNRLRQLGHIVPKMVVVSTPQGTDAQGLSGINAFQAGNGNIIQAYAKRELARQNIKELDVQVAVPRHFADDGTAFKIDTVYHVTYDRADIDENMYLYAIDYELTESGGQRTNLFFCRLGCIVADNNAPGAFL